jgi:hypothetical protein
MTNASSVPWDAALRDRLWATDWAGVATWSLGFGLILFLGLEGGGFDPLVHQPAGIFVWWILFAGLLVGALPRRRLSTLAWIALSLLLALAAWTALSLSWTESPDKTWSEFARVSSYLGVFALSLSMRGRNGGRQIVAGVGAGVAVVALIALLSRLQPDLLPDAAQTGAFLDRERLSFPLNYWNALAALIAIGVPLVLCLASDARSLLGRAIAAAALPAMALAIFFTLGRGGMVAAAIALVLFVALSSNRLPKLLTLLLAGAGASILIAAAVEREQLQEGFTGPIAQQQGDELLTITLLVCFVVGLVQVALSVALDEKRRPAWTVISRPQAMLATGLGVLALLVAAVSFDAPGRASDGWDEFKRGESVGRGVERLGSVAGLNRYDFWASAVDQNATEPLTGTGAGTFEYWWAREGDVPETIRDAHSLYLQTLGELGIVGLALLVAFLLVVLLGGARQALRRGRGGSQLAAAAAGGTGFVLATGFDWHWQIPVLPVALLLLASVLVERDEGAEGESAGVGERTADLPLRLGGALLALLAIAAIAIPLATTNLLRDSAEQVRAGKLEGALRDAQSAQNVLPGAAAPRLQQAFVLEEMGALRAAAGAASAATERESTNWRNWLVLARIEAERGRAAAAVRAYRRTRALNMHFSLFQR